MIPPRSPAFPLLLLIVGCSISADAQGLFGFGVCSRSERKGCFLGIFGSTMNDIDDQGECTEFCALFPFLNRDSSCGECSRGDGISTTSIEEPETTSDAPTRGPTGAPTNTPSDAPTDAPTDAPSAATTGAPTDTPTDTTITGAPTDATTDDPTDAPTDTPTLVISSASPTTASPVPPVRLSLSPTLAVQSPTSLTPTTANPTTSPMEEIETAPPTASPTEVPTAGPTALPTERPSDSPTRAPTTANPTQTPTLSSTEPQSPFEFNLDFARPEFLPEDQPFFQTAKERWEGIILSNYLHVDKSLLSTGPPEGCTFPEIFTSLHTCISYEDIDGESQILGRAGPTFLNPFNSLPISGTMTFDEADVSTASSDRESIVLHEMGHVLGVGTLWNLLSLATRQEDSSCLYSGDRVNAEYQAISGCDSVPLEPTGCGHFDETCLQDELMSPTTPIDGIAPFSRMTIAAAEDLGYGVDYSFADEFGESDLGPGCSCRSRELSIFERPHGESRQLGVRGAGKRRQLSHKARYEAIQYGLAHLEASKIKTNRRAGANEAIYVGDKLINVFVEEDGEVYGVLVKAEDYE